MTLDLIFARANVIQFLVSLSSLAAQCARKVRVGVLDNDDDDQNRSMR